MNEESQERFVSFCLFITSFNKPDEFGKFLENLELSMDHVVDKNPYMVVVPGDFNVKPISRFVNDVINIERSKIDILTASFGFNQVINKLTHILNNSSSCIDLIVTLQSNQVIESGVHSSHHQLTCNIQFKCYLSTSL